MANINLGRIGMVLKGEWNSSFTYNRLDVVAYAGGGYVSLVDNNNNKLPTDTAYWLQIAEKGEDGTQHAKIARFVVGTSTAGWTAADCDYLCDGTADQTEINAAITALPATGGEIVILDGTYNITGKINVSKDNVSIRGNGNATILKRMHNSSTAEGVITLTSRSGCKIANLQIEGNKTNYTSNNNCGIYLDSSSSNNTVTSNTCNNNNYGIYLGHSINNTVTSNTCNNNNYGIYLYNSSSNTVTGNTCIRGTGLATDYTESQHTIRLTGTGNKYNLISNNNCMGKAVTNEGGTGNTLVNNKFDDSDDIQALAEQVNTKKRTTRFVVGTSTAGWTAADCDYLCDGTADQTEINAAITALPATGGEVVILDGIYNITAEIIVSRNNTLIRGNGNATILKRGFDKSKSGVIRIDSKSGCKIESLLIDGNKTVYTGRHNYGIYLQSVNKTTVTLCSLILSREGGIYVNDGSCISITNNIFDGNTVYAVLLKLSTQNTIKNNIVIEWGKIKLDASNNNIINGNWVGDETTNATKIDLTDSNYNLIIGNNCENGTTGINLYQSSNNTIMGNSCFRGTGTPEDYDSNKYTIAVQSSSNDNLISSNNCKGKAVNVNSSTGNTLVNNKFDAT